MEVNDMTIFSPFDVRLEADVKYLKWKPQKIENFGITTADIESTRSEISKVRKGAVTLNEVVKHQKKWYQRKELKQIAIAAAAGASCVILLVILAAAVSMKFMIRLRRKNTTTDVEIGRLKKYVEDTFHDIRDSTLRMNTPSVPLPLS